uniref:Uncharacterized protein n=1 Tax=Anguilla anguilla TaxID=7936 RepID=A0A0E9STC5_ANGAN
MSGLRSRTKPASGPGLLPGIASMRSAPFATMPNTSTQP